MEVVAETAGLLIDALPSLLSELEGMGKQIMSMAALLEALKKVSDMNRDTK